VFFGVSFAKEVSVVLSTYHRLRILFVNFHMGINFLVQNVDSGGRAGILETAHGTVPTPTFMPVGTQASVKTLVPDELVALGADVILGNTYHLYLRPGVSTVREFGGLGKFMGWNGPTLTDSGGFQVYSLADQAKITDEGVEFRSHIDGGIHVFTPELVMDYQTQLGADIIMSFDQCIAYTDDISIARDAMHRTSRWAERCVASQPTGEQSLFGIIQGGMFESLRDESASFMTKLGFPGYAIGGLGVGEPKSTMYQLVKFSAALLPRDKPRYLMGVGSPEDLVRCVASGVDMFDCALPTRIARNGAVFTRLGRIDIASAIYKDSVSSVDDECDCYACSNFTLGYLNHLFKAKELLGLRLASIHNLRFVTRLMADVRDAIMSGTFEQFALEFLSSYQTANEEARLEQRRKLSR